MKRKTATNDNTPNNNNNDSASEEEEEGEYEELAIEFQDKGDTTNPKKSTFHYDSQNTVLENLWNVQNNDTAIVDISSGRFGIESRVPYEILLMIFKHLSKRDLTSCRCVSRYWYKVSLNDELRMFPLCDIDFEEFLDHEGYYNGHYYANYTAAKREKIFEDWMKRKGRKIPTTFGKVSHHSYKQDWKGRRECIELCDKDYDILAIVKLNYTSRCSSGLNTLVSIQDLNFNEEPWSIYVKLYDQDKIAPGENYGKQKVKKMKLKARQWNVEFNVNLNQLISMVENNLEIPANELIFSAVRSSHMDLRIECPGIQQQIPPLSKTLLPEAQPQGLKMSLYKYQLDAVNWMKHVEKQPKTNHFCSLVPLSDGLKTICLDFTSQKFITFGNKEVLQYIHTIAPSGGILADEMGLGKTVQMLALILGNPLGEEYQQDSMVTTKCTLVVCPNQLVSQWAEESRKFTNLKIITITTINSVKKLTVRDILNADALIVSFSFLSNKNYLTKKVGFTTSTHEWEKITIPNLSSIYWYRLIFDEAHEILDPSKKLNFDMSTLFQSKYRWYVTGTPFPNFELVLKAIKFLNFPCSYPNFLDTRNTTNRFVQVSIADIIFTNFFWRNTKDSVKDEYTVPDFVADTQFLDYHPTERAIYKSAALTMSQSMLLSIIGNPKITLLETHRDYSLSQLPSIMIKEKTNHLKNFLKKTLLETEQKLEKVNNKKTVENLSESSKEMIKHQLANLTREKTRIEKEIENTKKIIAYYTEASEQIQEERKSSNHKELLKLFEMVRQKRSELNLSSTDQTSVKQLQQILYQFKLDDSGTKKELIHRLRRLFHTEDINLMNIFLSKINVSDMAEEYGTKLAHLIIYLMKLFISNVEARVIIFSRENAILVELKTKLANYNIECTFVKGNVHQRNKAIGDFKSLTKARVIMLSLENAASGTNLTEASHIIFIDPMTGSKSEALATESQAIGRAHRQGQQNQLIVVKFVVRNTLEEKLHLRNNTNGEEGGEDQSQILENVDQHLEITHQVMERSKKLSLKFSH